MALVVLAALSAVLWWATSHTRTPEQVAARAAPPERTPVLAAVERQVIRQTVIQRGDVQAAGSLSVVVPSGVDEPIVTAVLVAAGDRVTAGQQVAEVAGRPVFVGEGAVPVFREMRPGMAGRDVAQLQGLLAGIGCDPERDGVYGPRTATCVGGFYRAAGYEPALSSPTEARDLAEARGRVDEARGALADAEAAVGAARSSHDGDALAARVERDAAALALADAEAARADAVAAAQEALARAQARLDELERTGAGPSDVEAARVAVGDAERELRATQRSHDAAVAEADGALAVAQGAVDRVAAEPVGASEARAVARASRELDDALGALAEVERTSGPTVPKGEVVFAPSLPAHVSAAVSTVGAIPPDRPAVVELVSGALVVHTRVSTADARRIAGPTPATLVDDQADTTYQAVLTLRSDTPTVSTDGTLAFDAVVAAEDPLPASLVGRNIRITFDLGSGAAEELAVPLAAVVARPDGSSVVDRYDGPGTVVHVPVEAGASGNGYIAVTPIDPSALDAGDMVVIG